MKYMSVLRLRFRRKKRTNFFCSPPAGTVPFAQSPLRLRGLAIKGQADILFHDTSTPLLSSFEIPLAPS